MAPSILEELPYPWFEPSAQALHQVLTRLYPTAARALMVAERAGIDPTFIDSQQPPAFVWHDILDQAAREGVVRTLVETARDQLNPSNPQRPFLEEILASKPVPLDMEPRQTDGRPIFIRKDDAVSEAEALLFHDDLTVEIGRVRSLIRTLSTLADLSPAVCRIRARFIGGIIGYGTGFRISEDLLLTNWHVLHNPEAAFEVYAEFGYEDDGEGGEVTSEKVRCDVESIRGNAADDWAVIALANPGPDPAVTFKLTEAAEPSSGLAAYILQHPGGRRKRLAFVRNQVSGFDERVVHYLTDTEPGSSGSPVMNAAGRLIALHHAGGTPQTVAGGPPIIKNEGIRIPRIIAGLEDLGITP